MNATPQAEIDPATDYDPLDPRVLEDPYPYYAALRRGAPVRRLERGFWVVSRYHDVLSVLRRPALFSSAAMAPAVTRPMEFAPDSEEPDDVDPEEHISIVGTDGARHARLRGVVNRGFTPARIAGLAPQVRAIARSLAEPLFEAGECEFVADFAVPLPVAVIAEMLGVDRERRADFKRWSDAAMRGVFEPLDEAGKLEVAERMQEMADHFDAVIEERRSRPGADLVSVLLRAGEDAGVLTPTEVQNFVLTLVVAGSITTTYLLGNALRALIAHPDQLAVVAASPGAIPAMVDEALRYDAPAQLFFRTATKDTELAGVRIPAGGTLCPLFGSANRDETVFPEPDRFDVARAPKDHLAFGHGIHFCLGAALARLEARTAFEVWLERVRAPEVTGPVPLLESLVFRGPVRLPLRFARA